MHPADIKAAMEKAGLTQGMIAAELGISQVTVSQVIRKDAISDRIMRLVSKKIGKDPREVFPEYYCKPPRTKHQKALTAELSL